MTAKHTFSAISLAKIFFALEMNNLSPKSKPRWDVDDVFNDRNARFVVAVVWFACG